VLVRRGERAVSEKNEALKVGEIPVAYRNEGKVYRLQKHARLCRVPLTCRIVESAKGQLELHFWGRTEEF
jgi:hypothetical protein